MTEAHQSHKPIIGLIGGVGSGKSLIARELAGLGCAVIDADQLAKAALEDAQVKEQLVAWWGGGVLDAAGKVDRKAVAARVFDAPQELGRLEELIHPRVHAGRRVLRDRYLADPAVKAIVEDCPLLIEKGLDATCDALILVRTSWENRVRRVADARGWSEADLAQREKNQIPLDTKALRADYVIDNDADEAHSRAQAERVLSRILHETA